jgi:hypothetical protein
MRNLILAVMSGCVFAWSSPAAAERYQILPANTHIGLARLSHMALLIDSETGGAFNCSVQFDIKSSNFAGESACIAVAVEGKLPRGQITLPTASPNFGWLPLWSVDQQSGAVTFCTARSTVQGLGPVLWCTPVVSRK